MELSRKAKSAHVERLPMAMADEELRSFTASAVSEVAVLPRMTVKPKRKSSSKKPSSRGKKMVPVESTATLLDGWGDFDTDRLLRDDIDTLSNDAVAEVNASQSIVGEDEEFINHDDQESMPEPPLTRRRSLKEQQLALEALARRGSRPPPSREPPKQVLRQRTFTVMELEAPEDPARDQTSSPSPNKLSKKPLVSHCKDRSTDITIRLPQLSSSNTREEAREEHRKRGSFGREIPDSHDSRRTIFTHLLPIWTVMGSYSASHSSSCSGSEDQDRLSMQDLGKSPLDCGMALMKICKAVGILLPSSPSPDVWLSSLPSKKPRRRRKPLVGFDSFCEVVVRNALQPAMHHFKLDRDMDEYIHTVDCVVQSLLIEDATQADSGLGWCLRELGEIQPVLPQWKTGIQIVQKQLPLGQSVSSVTYQSVEMHPCEGDPPPPDANVIRIPLGTSSSAKQLPATEARALQEANLKRKMQLRHSWQPWLIPTAQHEVQHQNNLPTKVYRSDADDVGALGSCMRVESVQRPSRPNTFIDNNHAVECSQNNHEDGDPAQEPHHDDELILICGTCTSEREATLWCSSCFAVFCAQCWTATHDSVVDHTIVDNQRELPAPTARPALLSHRGEMPNSHMSPPVDILYLPTKPLGVGKLQRGLNSHIHHVNEHANNTGNNESSNFGMDASLHLPQVATCPILPSIKPHKSRTHPKKTAHSHSTTDLETSPSPLLDSTANLLKALMLGTASSASLIGSSSVASSSPMTEVSKIKNTTKRTFKDPMSRKSLQPAAVTLDANLLLP